MGGDRTRTTALVFAALMVLSAPAMGITAASGGPAETEPIAADHESPFDAPDRPGSVEDDYDTPNSTERSGVNENGTEENETGTPRDFTYLDVVTFNWDEPNCPDQGVSDLDLYFDGDISSSDDDFHVDDGEGMDVPPPSGECLLRTESEGATITSTPGDQAYELNHYPSRGDDILFDYYAHRHGGEVEFRFGVQDDSNYYYVLIDTDDEVMELGKEVFGSRTVLDTTDIDVETGQLTTVEITWWAYDQGESVEAVHDAGGAFPGNSVFAWDDEFDEGGIAFHRSGTQGTIRSYANLIERVDAYVEEAEFGVDIIDYDNDIEPGEPAEVTAEITNYGNLEGTEEIELAIDDRVVDSETVTVDGGYRGNWESEEVTLDWVPEEDDAPSIWADVVATDSSNSDGTIISVLEPAEFDICGVETNGPIVEGEFLDVTVCIENTGEVSETQTIDVDVGSLGGDSRSIQLSGGEQTVETFTFSTGSGDAGSHTATASSDDDSDSEPVEVLAPSFFDVEITDTNSPIEEGDDLDVDVTIENTGDVSDVQTIPLDVGALGSDSVSVELDGGGSTVETLSVSTASGDAGGYTATASSDDDSDSQPVTVESVESAFFDVSIVDVNDPVEEGEPLAVEIAIENTGDEAATQQLSLAVDGSEVDSTSTTLGGGDSTSETLTYETEAGDASSVHLEVCSEDDCDDTTASVTPPEEDAFFDVSIVDVNDPVEEGETLAVDVGVENTGDVGATQTIALDVDGSVVDSETVTLGGGESTTETLTYGTESGDAPSVSITVESDDDGETTTATVESDGPLVDYLRQLAGDDGTIGTDELRTSIDDWRSGDISTEWLRVVIDYWRTGDPVP